VQWLDCEPLSNKMVSDPNTMETTAPAKRRSSLVVHRIPEEDDKTSIRKSVTFLFDNSSSGDGDAQGEHLASPSPLQLTAEICHDLWYQTPEITAMKQDAKRVLLNRTDSSPDERLGLERFNSQRAVWKRSAIHYVLMAQKQRHGEDFIRRVSQRCSAWAREMAIHQGFKDYCAVNDPLASLFGNEEENYNDCFFNEPYCCPATEWNSRRNDQRKAEDIETSSTTFPPITSERNVRQRHTSTVENDNYKEQRTSATDST
jgi:hypothetical protein